jgi:pseudouridine-5'-phosphate glycosidase
MKDSANSPNYTNEFSQIENMMKKVLLTLGLLLATTVMADEQPKADKEVIAEFKQYCTELAQEEGTDGKDLKVFMLECVNEELKSEGYQLMTTLV